jgi:hypothetical protein
VKDERDEGSFLMDRNQDIEGDDFLEFELTDSTAHDGDSACTFDSIFNDEIDLHSPVSDVELVDVVTVVVAPFLASADKFPFMSGKSAILLSEEDTTVYYPNSPIMESGHYNEKKTTKSYSRSFSLRRADQATSTPEGWFSQVDGSIKATKRSSLKKKKKKKKNTGNKSDFSPLADEVHGSTGGRKLFALFSLFCFRKTRAKYEF